MSVFDSKITIFRPKTIVWPSLGRISVEILMATTRSCQMF